MNEKQVDILIIGGGLTGAILLLALANQGLKCLLIDQQAFSDKAQVGFDARSLALSPASIHILEMLEIWPLLQSSACPIDLIHVSEQYRFASAKLKKQPDKPLGYVVEMEKIIIALHQLIKPEQLLAPAKLIALNKNQGQATLTTSAGEIIIKAKLIVAADGTDSAVRKLANLPVHLKHYQQHAIVANIGLARSHKNHAFERFTQVGPLALLPMTNQRAALVWALRPADAQRYMALSENDFLAELQRAFGYRLGRFNRVGKRVLFPLKQVTMKTPIAWPVVFVGNAAHTLHPVAGQGFNLGLRDVATLAQCIVQYGLNDNMLKTYQSMRQHDELAITRLTDGLVELFSCSIPGIGLARNLGLLAVDNSNTLKRILTHYTRGFAGITPDLVCGIALNKDNI